MRNNCKKKYYTHFRLDTLLLESWPNFFIVGAWKAGTTSLYSYLNMIPQVYMSPEKEPRYFNTTFFDSSMTRFGYGIGKRDKLEYLKLFRNVKDEKAIGEASPTYLQDPKSAKIIHEVLPHARIIILLRDPIERAYSHYLMFKLQGREKRSFDTIVRCLNKTRKDDINFDVYLDPGLYHEQVKRYLNIFGTKQVKVLIFEEFIEDPKKTVNEVLEFLGINAESPDILNAYNPYGVPRGKIGKYILESKTIAKWSYRLIPDYIRWKLKESIALKKEKKPELLKEERLTLENFYRDDMKKLQNLLKRKLPWEWLNNIS